MADDPIVLALVQKQLDHVARQMGWVMVRTARSPIFSESHDFSCFITDRYGNVISQADGIPIHTGGGGFAVRAVLRSFADDMGPGDVYLLSDPYEAGGNHLPDWTVIRPVFVEGELCAFTCNRAHQSDIGGGAAGTYNAAATEIFHEGIRLPVLRLVERGIVRHDLWRLLLLNSRCPELMDGDVRAMLGSTRIGAERVEGLIATLGSESGPRYLQAILDHAERLMGAEIARLPDGEYFGEDYSDNDCFEPADIAVRVRITVRGKTMVVDFEGSDPQIRGFKNSSLSNTHSSVHMALMAFMGSHLPRNDGGFRPVTINAPEGTVVNARPPAPMTMNTIYPAGNIVHACWKALSNCDPARACAGWGKIVHCVTAGVGEANQTFVMYHWHASAAGGAVQGRDGFATVGQLTTLGGMPLPNVEIYEQIYPVRISEQAFRCDAAGAGEYRGGTGVDYQAQIDIPAEYSFRGEGARGLVAFGTNGGMSGAPGRLRVATRDGAAITVPQFGVRRLPPCTLTISSAGGGGWGDPLKRHPEAVLEDVLNGVVSRDSARTLYGVVLSEAKPLKVDRSATEAQRQVLATSRRNASEHGEVHT